jgi:RimJ/RimL family protein N-acetyltransferase
MMEMINRLKLRLITMLLGVLTSERLLFTPLSITSEIIFEKTLDDTSFKTEAKVDIDVTIVQRNGFPKITNKLKKFNVNIQRNCRTADICAIAEIDGDPVHVRAVKLNEFYVEWIERTIQVGSDSAYLYGAYTVPEYRGLGVAPKVTEKVLFYLSQIGIRKVYALIQSNNFPSLRYAQKVGYTKIGTVTFIRISRLKLYRFKGETKKDYNNLIKLF